MTPHSTPTANKTLAYVALGVVYILWGSTFVAIRTVVAHMPPFISGSIRFLLAGLALLLFTHLTERWRKPTREQLLNAAMVGILLMGMGNGLVMWSQLSLPSGITALLVAAFPVWLTVAEALLSRGASLRGPVVTGVAVGLAGVVLIASAKGDISFAGNHTPIGALVGVQTATICWTIGYLKARSLKLRLPLVMASGLEMASGGAFLFVLSILSGEDWLLMVGAPAAAWAGIGYLALFGSIIGFTAFAYTRNTLPSHIVGTYAYVNPLVAVILGWLLFGETLSARTLLGGGMILAAVFVTNLPARPPARAGQGEDG